MKIKLQKISTLLTLILLLPLLALWGCDKRNNCCTVIDTAVQIYYKNTDGENLINSSEAFRQENIRIYYKNGVEYEYVYNGNLDAPNMHYVEEDKDGKKILTIFPSNYYNDNFSISLIELNEITVDTLLCEFAITNNSEICKNAWLNGTLLQNRYIEIAK
ncbi:MAG: hypothetical protein Q7T20_04190 [Saprospiraceae bacterium]|nr:hypothetical protein [Saprospiraceae bacterium]